jgi:hypothetical protein
LKLKDNYERLTQDVMRRLLLLLVFALPLFGQDAETSTAVVPVVGSVYGASISLWKTDVELVNDTGGAVTVALELTSVPGAAMILDLPPGATQRFTDIVGQAFGIDLALSPLRVTTTGRRSVTVRATAYATQRGVVSQMQPLGTAYRSEYAPFRALDGLGFSQDRRTNIGLVNFSTAPADFLLALQRLPGRDIAVTHVRVDPESLLHISIQSIFPLIEKGEHFRVVVETLNRDTYCYASVIDNDQNGTFVSSRVTSR